MRVETLIGVACQLWDIPRPVLIGKQKNRALTMRRHVVMYYASEKTIMSFPAIGRVMGDRDHTTIMHGRKQCLMAKRHGNEKLLALMAEFAKAIEGLPPEEDNPSDFPITAYQRDALHRRVKQTETALDELRREFALYRQEVEQFQRDMERRDEVVSIPCLKLKPIEQKPSQRKMRRCIQCGEDFMSDGPGNRRCKKPTCQDVLRTSSHLEGMTA